MLTIGAGGGSLAWKDEGGSLRNGPQSAGAFPGPACYKNGNEVATNTDANVVLGRLGTSLAGGKITLDPALAEASVRETVAEPFGMELHEAAEAVVAVANANMANAVRLLSISRGYDPRDFALVAFGGAGALPADHQAGDLHPLVGRQLLELAGRAHPPSGQRRAMKSHGVNLVGQAQETVVRRGLLQERHGA